MSYILINSENFFHNLDLIKSRVGSIDKISIVLKDNAYGHGLEQISSLAKEYGITNAIVRNLNEADLIKDKFKRVLVLSEVEKFEAFDNISISVNSIENLKKFKNGSNIELKVDSGMHRNGILADEFDLAFDIISQKKLNLKAIFTHFRSADELSSELFWQMENFKKIKEKSKDLAKKYSFKDIKFHSANSATTFRLNSFDEDFVRVGIASYGYLENDYLFSKENLKPVLSLFANRVSTRDLLKNERVGYGGAFQALENTQVSTYDIGYADFLRLNEKHKFTTTCGARILGKVSMDSMSIASIKDEICIFDDVTLYARAFDTIVYEILLRLSNTIERRVV